MRTDRVPMMYQAFFVFFVWAFACHELQAQTIAEKKRAWLPPARI